MSLKILNTPLSWHFSKTELYFYIFFERSDFMNYIYPAIFYPETDEKYSVIFPDLNNLATYGDNLADAFVMAQEACGQYLFTSLKDGDVLPVPTAINAMKSDDPTAFINLICVNSVNYVCFKKKKWNNMLTQNTTLKFYKFVA